MPNLVGSLKTRSLASLMTAALAVSAMPIYAASPLEILLEDYESPGSADSAAAVHSGNSAATGPSNTVIEVVENDGSNRLRITDADGTFNGAVQTFPGAIPGPGYYLITADIKVDNSASHPIGTFGMAAVVGGPTTSKISDLNAGYVMNLTGAGDAALGYQTVGAAINVPAGGSFPQDLTLYFSTDPSGNDFNGATWDGNFSGTHRGGLTAWPAGSSNAVYIDNIKRIGPGNMGEERHLWISVGDGYTDLAKLESLLVQAKQNNFSAVDILARYRGDAYYVPNRTDASYPNPEPFGTRVGTTPASVTNDPLQYTIDRCRELGLKVYISFGCFLVSPNNVYPSTLPPDSIMWYYNNGSPRPMVASDPSAEGLWADPGLKSVRDYTKNVLMDIVSNYDIDGVIFDRVRYPNVNYSYNPQALAEMGITGTPAPTDANLREARRNVIASFISECYEAVTAKKPWVVVGVTPIAFADNLNDTYNGVFQGWYKWTAAKTSNRAVSFGSIDLFQPQFYRLWNSSSPFEAPEANTRLMNRALFGDRAAYSLDFGLMPGAYSALSPLFYHPNAGDANQSRANAQNITDARELDLAGWGLFAATTSLADISLIRDPAASSAGVDVLASPAPAPDYLFKKGYEKIAPNPVTNFSAAPQPRGSVVLTWDPPAPASDGDTAAGYYIYKSTTSPVKETYANQVNKLPLPGDAVWYHAPVGAAGSYYYRIVAVDDYNNRSEAVEIGPYTVAGEPPIPDDIIVDNPEATRVGTWSVGTSAVDKYGPDYVSASKGPGDRSMTFSAVIPVSGTWDVYEWHNQGSNRAADAPHTITHAAGQSVVVVNQMTGGGRWNKLGSFTLNAGNTYSVKIDNQFTVGTVIIADAIRWSYVTQPSVTPAAPTDLTASLTGKTQVDLTWNDNADNETGYEVERWIKGGTSHVIVTLPADITSYSDENLAPDTEYVYVVRAYNTGTQSADSNIVTIRTLPDVQDIIVDNRQATFVGSWVTGTFAGMFDVDYQYAFKGTGAKTATFTANITRTAIYDIYEWHVAGTNRASDAEHKISTASGVVTVLVDQKLNGGQWNKIATVQLNAGPNTVVITDNYVDGSVVMADAIKWVYNSEPVITPEAPSGLVATVLSDTEVALAWSDNADNETAYEVQRTRTGGTPEIVAALAPDTISYTDTGLDGDTEYTYVVRAVRGAVKSDDSNAVTVRTLRGMPKDVIVEETDAVFIGTWSTASSSVDKSGAAYRFKSKSANGAGKAIYTLPARDTGVYEVFEWHPMGSNRPTDARHTIKHRDGETVVLVNQQINGGQWNSLGLYALEGGTDCVVTIDDLFVDGTVVMADAIKLVWVGDLPPAPAAPSGLTLSGAGQSGASGLQVTLNWTDNADSETGYQVVRNGSVVAHLPANSTSFTDEGLSECTPYTYTVVAVGLGGNSDPSNAASVTLDVTKPTITAPPDVTVSNTAGQCGATGVDLGMPVTADNCGGVSVTNDAPAEFPVGTTTVTWTVTDAQGNQATATQTVTVTDDEDPTITAPEDVTVGTDAGSCSASDVDLGTPVTDDNCGVASVTNDAPAVFSKGVTTVTWTVVDIHGNTATATQTVTVEDREKPVINCPADIEIGSSVDLLVPVEYEAEATDNCGDVSVTFDPPSGSGFPVGTTEVTVTATDAAGNQATCTFKVTRRPLTFSGFLPPIGGSVETGNGGSYANPVKAFKLNSTIPVKMILSSDGVPVSTGVHTLQLIKYSDETHSLPPIDATPTDAATTGNQFRLTSASTGEWHFNLKTKDGFSKGTWLLVATLSDGSQGTVWITLK